VCVVCVEMIEQSTLPCRAVPCRACALFCLTQPPAVVLGILLFMKIDYTQTKKMIVGPLARRPPQPLSENSKLLGINVSRDMNWQLRIDTITHKAASRLHFLRILN